MPHTALPDGYEFKPFAMPPVGGLTDAGSILNLILEWMKNQRDRINTGILDQNGRASIAQVEGLDGAISYYGDFGENGGNTFAQDGDAAYRIVNSWNFDGVQEISSFAISLPTKTEFFGQMQVHTSRVKFGYIQLAPVAP